MKTCATCGVEKSLDDFHKKGKYYYSKCKDCWRAYTKAHYQNNTQYYKDKAKVNRKPIWEQHGMSMAAYQVLWNNCGGKCQICGADATVIDHDHSCCSGPKSCGKCVRGLLCGNCNSVIGFAKDSSDTLIKAAAYVAMVPLTD